MVVTANRRLIRVGVLATGITLLAGCGTNPVLQTAEEFKGEGHVVALSETIPSNQFSSSKQFPLIFPEAGRYEMHVNFFREGGSEWVDPASDPDRHLVAAIEARDPGGTKAVTKSLDWIFDAGLRGKGFRFANVPSDLPKNRELILTVSVTSVFEGFEEHFDGIQIVIKRSAIFLD